MNSTKTHNALKLHLGCGTNVVEGWINIDYSLGAHLAKIPLSKFFLRKTGLLRNEWDSRIMLHDLRKNCHLVTTLLIASTLLTRLSI
jgi:hypothetical protein